MPIETFTTRQALCIFKVNSHLVLLVMNVQML